MLQCCPASTPPPRLARGGRAVSGCSPQRAPPASPQGKCAVPCLFVYGEADPLLARSRALAEKFSGRDVARGVCGSVWRVGGGRPPPPLRCAGPRPQTPRMGAVLPAAKHACYLDDPNRAVVWDTGTRVHRQTGIWGLQRTHGDSTRIVVFPVSFNVLQQRVCQ